jgi:hypothetical protein
LTYIEINFFHGDALKNQQVQELFPVYYDHIVSQIDENTNLFYFFDTLPRKKLYSVDQKYYETLYNDEDLFNNSDSESGSESHSENDSEKNSDVVYEGEEEQQVTQDDIDYWIQQGYIFTDTGVYYWNEAFKSQLRESIQGSRTADKINKFINDQPEEEDAEDDAEDDAEYDAEHDAEEDAEDDAEDDAEYDAEYDAEHDAEDDAEVDIYSKTKLRLFLNNITDDYIFKRGRKLSKLIYFAEDVDVEISDLETYLQREDVKDDSEEDSYENSASSEEEVEMREGPFLEDKRGDNTGMGVAASSSSATATSETVFDDTSFLSQPHNENNFNPFQTPQTVTAGLQEITYNPESVMTTKVGTDINNESMEETGGRKPGRHKSKKNKHKISIKNKSKKNIKKKRTIKNKRTIKKKITKRHKKTRKQN